MKSSLFWDTSERSSMGGRWKLVIRGPASSRHIKLNARPDDDDAAREEAARQMAKYGLAPSIWEPRPKGWQTEQRPAMHLDGCGIDKAVLV